MEMAVTVIVSESSGLCSPAVTLGKDTIRCLFRTTARVFKCDIALQQRCSNIVQSAVADEAMEQGQHIDKGRGEVSRPRLARPTALGAGMSRAGPCMTMPF